MNLAAPDLPLFQALKGLSLIPAMKGALEEQGRKISALVEQLARKNTEEPDSDRWLDAKAAAAYLSLSKGTFDSYRYQKESRITGHPLDGKTLYKKSDLDTWVRLYSLKSEGRA